MQKFLSTRCDRFSHTCPAYLATHCNWRREALLCNKIEKFEESIQFHYDRKPNKQQSLGTDHRGKKAGTRSVPASRPRKLRTAGNFNWSPVPKQGQPPRPRPGTHTPKIFQLRIKGKRRRSLPDNCRSKLPVRPPT